uniref:Uncharacterized protein n=1 Tax=uncultured marine group II/III euryarchaeote KM3_85_D06 TaxID=1456528 RepID=A0A075HTH4_9EURY|nr:hypothetical protein [uncultured marine group II/III euryarchaeote KM3_85_D06]
MRQIPFPTNRLLYPLPLYHPLLDGDDILVGKSQFERHGFWQLLQRSERLIDERRLRSEGWADHRSDRSENLHVNLLRLTKFSPRTQFATRGSGFVGGQVVATPVGDSYAFNPAVAAVHLQVPAV